MLATVTKCLARVVDALMRRRRARPIRRAATTPKRTRVAHAVAVWCYVAMQLPAEGATAGDAPRITCTDPLSGTVHETVVGVVAPGAKAMT